ncbi:propionate catabolism operon transcriptional regulator [Caldalkalibacillus uzonensis]|uniref:Propionate catabolism operon transcriptional regulator n=1 Tax=Caldalkalibacillus uzonensis TaxID=353224 RepID=A0ABU0CWN8_9BACI|nr:sigma 54-interacting transcriptional regulator [Caldalkalibacillus uzonensis]MDQ0340839.1 propionate catabolism operon transcriptional regulator [Caldalkalibacillus uzonensis]
MTTKILIISHPNFTQLCYEVYKTVNLPIKLEVLEVGFAEFSKRIDLDYVTTFDLVITSGAHLEIFKREFSELLHLIPIYPLHFTEADVVKALVKAKAIGNKVLLMYSNYETYPLEEYKRTLNLDVKHLIINSLEEAENLLERYQKKGYDTVIGTSSICKLAESLGINSILVYSNDALRLDLIKAYQFAATKKKMMKYVKFKEAIFDQVINPLFITDSHGSITDVNAAGLRLINRKVKHEVRGQNITEVLDQGLKRLDEKRIGIEINGKLNGYVSILRLPGDFNEEAVERYANSFQSKYTFKNIIADSLAMKRVIVKAKQYSRSTAPILLYGESGTGKELLAHSIHQESDRRHGPFLPVNCSAIPQNILESELFGYEEGAFTGAKRGGKPGFFEMAQGGTIFLDEIGELSLEIQTKLLRVLQEREVIRLGGKKVIPLNVRIITATNKSLIDLVKRGMFREDLYYRINVLQINVPPLRERQDDIIPIFKHLLFKHGMQEDHVHFLIKLAGERLLDYEWCGNIRELENFVQRLTALTSVSTTTYDLIEIFKDVLSEHFKFEAQQIQQYDKGKNNGVGEHYTSYQEAEKVRIIQALLDSNGNKIKAAQKLGISRTTLWRKIKQYQLQ